MECENNEIFPEMDTLTNEFCGRLDSKEMELSLLSSSLLWLSVEMCNYDETTQYKMSNKYMQKTKFEISLYHFNDFTFTYSLSYLLA